MGEIGPRKAPRISISPVIQLGKNQATSTGLNCSGNDDRLASSEVRFALVNHDHGSVGEIPHGLVLVFTAFDKFELQFIPR